VVTKRNKIFSGNQPRQNGTIVQCVRGPLCLHHQGKLRWLSCVCYLYTQHMPLLVRPLASRDWGPVQFKTIRSRVAAPCTIQSLCVLNQVLHTGGQPPVVVLHWCGLTQPVLSGSIPSESFLTFFALWSRWMRETHAWLSMNPLFLSKCPSDVRSDLFPPCGGEQKQWINAESGMGPRHAPAP
jgi:hypothetical protein